MPAAVDCCACGCVSLRSSSKTERQKYMSFNSLWGSGVVKRESYLTTPDWPGVFGWLHVLSFCLRVKWLLTGYRINAHHRSYSGGGSVSLRSSSKTERQKYMSYKTLRGSGVAKRESYLTTPAQSGVFGRPQVLSFCLGRIASHGKSWVF